MHVGESNPTGIFGLATVTFDGKNKFENFKVYIKKGSIQVIPPYKTDSRNKRYPIVTLTLTQKDAIIRRVYEIVKVIT
jgi:hypothetical protein